MTKWYESKNKISSGRLIKTLHIKKGVSFCTLLDKLRLFVKSQTKGDCPERPWSTRTFAQNFVMVILHGDQMADSLIATEFSIRRTSSPFRPFVRLSKIPTDMVAYDAALQVHTQSSPIYIISQQQTCR